MHACEGGVEFLRGGGAAFDLVEGIVEDFGDIEETDDVAFFVADRLVYGANENYRIEVV